MGGLVQQINLYRPDMVTAKADRNARLLLTVAIASLAAVLLLTLAGELYLSNLADQRATVAEQLRKQQADVARVRDSLVAHDPDPFLEAELDRLQRQVVAIDTNLVALNEVRPTGSGFADFFAGLARNTVDGLWFDGVVLSAGGREVMLKGVATDPALVPRLLQTLTTEPAFNGRSFRKVSFQRQPQEQGGLVGFELRSAQVSGADDAS
ncbi:MAG: hypothetical protein KDI82_04515 [Gammaproteobacteria bacterium]|nr:hypothetical protein [Gammaproteobacteria bacterium]